MNGDPTDIDLDQSSGPERAAMVAWLVEQLPGEVAAALDGDQEALIALLEAAVMAQHSPGRAPGTVEEVAVTAHRLADAVADCYSEDRPPSDRLCDLGFALADRVEALAAEVLYRRAQAGVTDRATLGPSGASAAQEARHLARAHVAALRDAALTQRVVSEPDVDAARHLYRAIVTLARQHVSRTATATLADSASQPAAPPATPRRT